MPLTSTGKMVKIRGRDEVVPTRKNLCANERLHQTRRSVFDHIVKMNNHKSRSSRLILFLVVAAIGFAVDLATKHWIFGKLGLPGQQDVWWIIPNVFGFQTSLNAGALFGIGQGQIPLFVTLSFVALTGVCWWVWSDVTKSRYLAFTLGLIAAGILGNLWDRCALHGMKWTQFDIEVWNESPELLGQPVHAVRDWILVMLGNYPWPNFNIADSCLVCGALLIGIYALFAPNPDPKKIAADAGLDMPEDNDPQD